MSENPVTKRLVQLGEKWQTFEENTEARLGIWEVTQDQARMIDAFVMYEDTNAASIPSIFFSFDYNFNDYHTYAGDLIDDFFERIRHETSQKALLEADIPIDLLEVPEERTKATWLKTLSAFGHLVVHLEGCIVAYLNPKKNSDPKAWVNWMADLLEEDIPSNVRLMVKAEEDGPTFESLTNYFAKKAIVLDPELDMAQAMQEVFDEATKGTEDHPGVKFQKAFMNISKHAAKKEMPEAEKYAEEALEIARAEDWPHLQVAALMSLGGGYIGTKEFEKAIQTYEQARSAAQAYTLEEPELGPQLEVQVLFGVAGSYLGLRDYENGGKYYAMAGPIAEGAKKELLALEAWRMTGFCCDYTKDHYGAWDYYQKALAVGRQMDEPLRKASTLAYVGEALLKLCKKVGEDQKKYDIDDEMTRLMGENWQELTQITTS